VKQDFDVVIIGGGHAGAEAAHAAARLGVATALVTLERDGIGVMSCNPAIGGLGKGHLVREIDALDGVMGKAADASGIQFRLLNRRKGPAVQGPRTQADRHIYRKYMLSRTDGQPNLEIIEGEVADFIIDGGCVRGVILADGFRISARSVVLTTGTFLRGVIHIGDVSRPGGRMGDKPSVRLAERIDDFGLSLGRLKTGTPPRLDGRSIDWSGLEMQEPDVDPVMFSFLSEAPTCQQVSCGITHTNPRTHDIIKSNLERSAMYGGRIDGAGPRYCPSIEDKVVRFGDKEAHQIFLEPESLSDSVIYPNGISTSLPVEVQEEYVRSISGLEDASILQPGYAIEYDFVDPRALDSCLAVKGIPGLLLAGQINGTTGYEEAAAQGLVAGLNAALSAVGRDVITFSRCNSYIGVMIDDLVTRGVSEPYRMFTSRAEFRLSLRADNADQRLTPLGIEIGCVSERRKAAFEEKMDRLEAARRILESESYSANALADLGLKVSKDGSRRNGLELLSMPQVGFQEIIALNPGWSVIDQDSRLQLEREALYASYIERQKRDVAGLQRDESQVIPEEFDYAAVTGLSNELKEKLKQTRPGNLGQAGRIDGMTPAALTLILSRIRQGKHKDSA